MIVAIELLADKKMRPDQISIFYRAQTALFTAVHVENGALSECKCNARLDAVLRWYDAGRGGVRFSGTRFPAHRPLHLQNLQNLL